MKINFSGGGGVITRFKRHSAGVKCTNLGGFVKADYDGPMTIATCTYLGRLVSEHAGRRQTIERLDRAMTMTGAGMKPDVEHLYGSLPGCYIVRADQYDQMHAFCGFLVQFGVMRVTFLESRYETALRWMGAR